ncbi:hydroxyisourate hydrolase [Aspergillus saccharolyticus JOP 1030-1]|uniref:hydroxyisourate hydrolase n=1 Tax=Aspergillus saccharolyticus JOP 1030-1 TaxID=1450539 RepID=A0A318Z3N4_9EURO|nr:Hydroxyisourate hydrolase [Aspergillus saccharolyticus JOP 1030-1]PYH41024.1 Hydroxyisourate hydrolase [Aspergillus saccharolyticus JOP 1030-1]
MDSTQTTPLPPAGPTQSPRDQPTERLNLYRNQIIPAQAQSSSTTTTTSFSSSPRNPTSPTTQSKNPSATMSRDPITCHVLNTLTGTPAANLPVTLTLLSPSTNTEPTATTTTFHATTNADGRVANWTPANASSQSQSVSSVLAALPAPDSKTNWALRFEVGPWFEAQGVESFWPEVEVKFTVKGRGKEGEEGWRHYHVPVLLGPWNYSTYRGS